MSNVCFLNFNLNNDLKTINFYIYSIVATKIKIVEIPDNNFEISDNNFDLFVKLKTLEARIAIR